MFWVIKITISLRRFFEHTKQDSKLMNKEIVTILIIMIIIYYDNNDNNIDL